MREVMGLKMPLVCLRVFGCQERVEPDGATGLTAAKVRPTASKSTNRETMFMVKMEKSMETREKSKKRREPIRRRPKRRMTRSGSGSKKEDDRQLKPPTRPIGRRLGRRVDWGRSTPTRRESIVSYSDRQLTRAGARLPQPADRPTPGQASRLGDALHPRRSSRSFCTAIDS